MNNGEALMLATPATLTVVSVEDAWLETGTVPSIVNIKTRHIEMPRRAAGTFLLGLLAIDIRFTCAPMTGQPAP